MPRQLLYHSRWARVSFPSSDRLNPRDDTGLNTIALLNIQMIDVGGGIEVDVGNGTFEPSRF